MTEAEWINSDNPRSIFRSLNLQLSDRKIRLYACAVCRLVWDTLTDPRERAAVDATEHFADGAVGLDELELRWNDAWKAYHESHHSRSLSPKAWAWVAWNEEFGSTHGSRRSVWACAKDLESALDSVICSIGGFKDREKWNAQKAQVFRHLVGSPFRPVSSPGYATTATIQLAEALYAGEPCSFALHDTLLDAGHPDLAAHFREPEHPKGCWALDLILGKQ